MANTNANNGNGPSSISGPLSNKVASEGDKTAQPADSSKDLDVLIHVEPGQSDRAADQARAAGANVKSNFGEEIHASIPANAIEQLGNAAAIRLVDEYDNPRPMNTSEGVVKTNTDQVHSMGFTGNGVTIAVIDIGFDLDNDKIKDNVVATEGNSNYFYNGTTGEHGTGCAECVVDMAPDCDLVLASAAYYDFTTLMDEIVTNHDPEVMTMSLGYKQNRRINGQDSLSQRISQYTSNGGIFTVSAGNEAAGAHWDGEFKDTNGNGLMEFDDQGTEKLRVNNPYGVSEEIIIHWDEDWDTDSERYSAQLFDDSGTQIDSSYTTSPYEILEVPSTEDPVFVQITNENASGNEYFDLFRWGNYINFENYTAERSIGVPATSPDSNTLSVAAVQATDAGRMPNEEDLKNYSSRGPTQDGRRGIDIAGPSYVSQLDPDNDGFNGTSAAAPHIGGAATALSEQAGVTDDDVREALLAPERGIADSDVGSPPNREIGFGYLETKITQDYIDLSVSATGENISRDGQATIDITAENLEEIVVSDLWTDWTVESHQDDGGSFSNNVGTDGTCTFTWDSSQTSTSTSVTVHVPDPPYVGGTYGVTVTASTPDVSVQDTAIIDVT